MVDKLKPKSAEKEIAYIDSLINELKGWELRNPKDPEVQRVLELTRGQVGVYRYALPKDLLITYHGSLQYNDPVNLDLDLYFTFGTSEQKKEHKHVVDAIEYCFLKCRVWPRMGNNEGRCDTNFGTFSMEELVENVTATERKRVSYYHDYTITPLYVSALLTSKALFDDQENLLAGYRADAAKLLPSARILRKEVTEDLEEAVKLRRDRNANRSTEH